jgi:tetratricopeptide (TPR) repeat protein
MPELKSKLKEAVELLKANEFAKAEDILLSLKQDYPKDSFVNYLLGCIYEDYKNPKRDRENAKKYFIYATETEEPIEDAFVQLARLERNKKHSIRILKKGLEFFSSSEDLYFLLATYSDEGERKQIFHEIDKKGISSERIQIMKVETFFDSKEFVICIDILKNLQIQDDEGNMILKVIKGFCYLESGDFDQAKQIFQVLINDDIKQQLHYAPYFGMILTVLPEAIKEAEGILYQIPEGTEVTTQLIAPPNLLFDFEKYFLDALKQVEQRTQDRIILGKIRGLRGLCLYTKASEGNRSSESDTSFEQLQKEVILDLEFANQVFPQNTEFCQRLQWIYSEEKKNHFKAWEYAYQYAINSRDEDYFSCEFIQEVSKTTLQKIVRDFTKKIGKDEYGLHTSRISKTLLGTIIERLYKEKDYSQIVKISELFSDDCLTDSDVLFEIAYSFGEVNDIGSSEKYYLLYKDKFGETSAVLNNLGVIYEKRGAIEESMLLYKRSLALENEDKTARNNLERVSKIIREKDRADFELREALETFDLESPYVKNKVLEFWQHRRNDGLIICSYRQLPQYLKMSGQKAPDFIKDLVEKKYFLRIAQHEIDTQSSVYKLNPHLERILIETQDILRKEEDFLTICEKLNTNYLNSLGYDKNLITNLNRLSSSELKDMLQRDILETVLSLVTKCYKSTLVLSGSIIEAVLLDRIKARNISKYLIGKGNRKISKAVDKMDLCELIEVAEKENIINSTYGHLSHFLRGFRNLIHPSVEQRKKLVVSKENAELAWTVAKKLISEVR